MSFYKAKTISVLIAAYNEEKYIAIQLDALSGQVYDGDWELILINNCCSDKTMEIAEKYLSKFKRILFLNAMDKRSKGYALNIGAKRAQGEVFLFTDAHAVVGDEWLSRMANAMAEHDFVAGGLEMERLRQKNAPVRPTPQTGSNSKFMGFLPYCIGANMGISREAFNRVGGFCEEYKFVGEDAEISFKLQLCGFKIQDRPDAIVHYRIRETLSGLRKQMVNYGVAHAMLYSKFRYAGMRRRPIKDVILCYLQLLIVFCTWFRRSKEEKQEGIRSLAAHWGRLKGSMRYRVFYL